LIHASRIFFVVAWARAFKAYETLALTTGKITRSIA